MKILLTGAGGQLGRSLQAVLGAHEVTPADRARLDITSLPDVRAAVRAVSPDAVINAAAFNEVDRAESDAEPAVRGNIMGPRNLALATADQGIPLVHVSTDYVFDGEAKVPYDEGTRPNPLSVYGATKLAGEEAVRAMNPRSFLVRTAWLYHPEGRNFPNTLLRLGVSEPKVRVVDDQQGSPTYAPHLAQAIARLIETDAWGTYHFAGSGGTSWFGLTKALFALCGLNTPIEPVSTAAFPRPAPRPRYSVLTTTQEPRIVLPPWEEGLAEFARVRQGSRG